MYISNKSDGLFGKGHRLKAVIWMEWLSSVRSHAGNAAQDLALLLHTQVVRGDPRQQAVARAEQDVPVGQPGAKPLIHDIVSYTSHK